MFKSNKKKLKLKPCSPEKGEPFYTGTVSVPQSTWQ